MKTRCCLITVGGTGHRLKKGGIEFLYSKSSLQLLGKPMIYWLLKVLERVGIEKIVMTSERRESLEFVKETIKKNFADSFEEICYHIDPGFGSTGLPYQTKDLLDFPCFFEAGHSFQKPEHYEKMDREYKNGYLVLSGFPPKGYAPRYTVKIEKGRIEYIGKKFSTAGEIEVGSPKIFGKDFVDILPKLEYELDNIIPYYIKNKRFKVILSDMPLEVDVKKEWEEAIPAYRRFIEEELLQSGNREF